MALIVKKKGYTVEDILPYTALPEGTNLNKAAAKKLNKMLKHVYGKCIPSCLCTAAERVAVLNLAKKLTTGV